MSVSHIEYLVQVKTVIYKFIKSRTCDDGLYVTYTVQKIILSVCIKLRKDIIERDERDMNREVSPLKQAEDAVLVDSSEMGIDDVVNAILNVYKEKVQK